MKNKGIKGIFIKALLGVVMLAPFGFANVEADGGMKFRVLPFEKVILRDVRIDGQGEQPQSITIRLRQVELQPVIIRITSMGEDLNAS